MCRQRAGCNPGTAKADGRGLGGSGARDLEGFKSFKCLKPGKRMPQRRVLRVWRLANGRLERPNNRGLCAGKGQAATLEQQRLTARGCGGSCREGSGGFEEFSLFEACQTNAPTEGCWQTAGLNALTTEGYVQAKGRPMLEQQRLTARGLGGSCREGSGGFEEL